MVRPEYIPITGESLSMLVKLVVRGRVELPTFFSGSFSSPHGSTAARLSRPDASLGHLGVHERPHVLAAGTHEGGRFQPPEASASPAASVYLC
jgi:hypothetical protein